MTETKISKGYQTVIPAEVRKAFSIGVGDKLLWRILNKGVVVTGKKKRKEDPLLAMIGSIKLSKPVDATKELDGVLYE